MIEKVCLLSLVLQVYKNLFKEIVTTPGTLERPSWWREAADKPELGSRHHQIAPPRAKL